MSSAGEAFGIRPRTCAEGLDKRYRMRFIRLPPMRSYVNGVNSLARIAAPRFHSFCDLVEIGYSHDISANAAETWFGSSRTD